MAHWRGAGVIVAFLIAQGLGIGFTMAIFVSNLAFSNSDQIELSKVAVLCGSVVAAVVGYVFLRMVGKE